MKGFKYFKDGMYSQVPEEYYMLTASLDDRVVSGRDLAKAIRAI